ncbi:hypothetical protein R3P38DRAFT_2870614 [Favolaschia claudopus]|uniref:Arrestin-like N-terminal domain-containing protein n=1 Tax=Favolaschia claudopus TaxID=2862362 RepID=A0AAW0DBT0_9AGAR
MPVPRPSVTLPPYRCSDTDAGALSPPYSPEPSEGEERLSRSSIVGRLSPTGEFKATNGRITLLLKDQEDRSPSPTYRPNELVKGKICIQNSESVTDVVLKLHGRLDLAASNGGQPIELVNDSYTVWSDNTMGATCPESIPFSFIFPSTFKDSGEQIWPLPPSIRITPQGPPLTYVKCSYTLSIVVSTTLHPRLLLWRGEKTLSVAVTMRPTAYPPRPITPDTNLLSTIKTAPEEWYQILCDIGHKLAQKNIDCNLFIPSALTYGLSDSIPFHLQISGPAPILTELVRRPSPSGKATKQQDNLNHPVCVHLMRRVSLLVHGESQDRDTCMGEGVLSFLPPPIAYSEKCNPQDAAVDWEGTVQCDSSISVGTFTTGPLYVNDFIVVSIPAWNVIHKHPIQFVSHTWRDDPGPGDRT